MPYGCAIKDYASGLCQPPSAHYKPYARSTAVSPNARNVSLGIYGQVLPGDPCALPGAPSPAEHLSGGEKGRGMRGAAGRGDQLVWLAWAEPARHGERWHKTAP